MATETEHPEPSDALLTWAVLQQRTLGLMAPLDRPWFWSASPPMPADWEFACRCRATVPVKRHTCDDDSQLWLGQCPRCQAVLWSHREVTDA